MRLLSSFRVFGLASLVGIAGCGGSLFGSAGTGSFTADEKPFFEGCTFEEISGLSRWTCGHGNDERVIEHRRLDEPGGQDAAVAAYTAGHPERGAIAGRKDATIHFTSGGKDVANTISLVQQKGTLTFVAAGPSAESTGPSRAPFYASCTFKANEQITSIADAAGVGVGITLCKRSIEGVLGVVDRHHP